MKPEPSQVAASPASFQLGRLLVVLVPLAVLAVGGLLGWGYFDIPARWNSLNRPRLVGASGTVMFAGEPLALGQLDTQHENPEVPGAFGFIDKEGKFQLKTRIDGNLVDGAFPGKHKVTAYKIDTTSRAMMARGPSITPEVYSSFETTPLLLVVSDDPAKNHYDIRLEGEPRQANPPVAEAVDPRQVAEFVADQIRQYDQDGDEKLSKDEIAAVAGVARISLLNADADGDGLLDQAELTTATTQLLKSNPGSLGAGGGAGGPPGRGKPLRPASDDADGKPREKSDDSREKPASADGAAGSDAG